MPPSEWNIFPCWWCCIYSKVHFIAHVFMHFSRNNNNNKESRCVSFLHIFMKPTYQHHQELYQMFELAYSFHMFFSNAVILGYISWHHKLTHLENTCCSYCSDTKDTPPTNCHLPFLDLNLFYLYISWHLSITFSITSDKVKQYYRYNLWGLWEY